MAVEGLEDVVAAETEMSFVDGDEGELVYRGYNIHELASGVAFEELLPLFWDGELPAPERLKQTRRRLEEGRELPSSLRGQLESWARADADPMVALRSFVSALAGYHRNRSQNEEPSEDNREVAFRLTASMPLALSGFQRARQGDAPASPDPSGDLATDFLRRLTGRSPSELEAEVFNTCLVLHADHGLNASTFSARVTASTLSDLYAAVTSAVGTLMGPLHGGANADVMSMLLEIDREGKDPVGHVREKLRAGRKIPGFGHRVYNTEDPRATHLRDRSEQLGEAAGDLRWFEYSRAIEDFMLREKQLHCNVDFYSASTYYQLGIPVDCYPAVFACGRVVGWAGHVMEQRTDNRLIRPRAEYVGPRDRELVPLEERE